MPLQALQALCVMHLALTQESGVRFSGGALCGCDGNLAHLAGSNPAVWEFESPHPHSMPGRLMAGLLTLDQAIEVRVLAGQLTPSRTAAAPPSYGGWPGSAPGGGSTSSQPYRRRHRRKHGDRLLVREAEATAIACAGARRRTRL